MKLTKEKLQELIKEEISYLSEQENANQKIDAAQQTLEADAKAVFNKIKQIASQEKLDIGTLKTLFLDSFQKQG